MRHDAPKSFCIRPAQLGMLSREAWHLTIPKGPEASALSQAIGSPLFARGLGKSWGAGALGLAPLKALKDWHVFMIFILFVALIDFNCVCLETQGYPKPAVTWLTF